jgi:hypothetical protein
LELTQSFSELERDKKAILKDMRQNEIIHEKDTYKLNAKLKEYKYIIHEQKKTILDLDQDLLRQKHMLAVRATEQQMVSKGQGSFVSAGNG